MTLPLRGLIYMNPLVVDKIGKGFYYWKDSGFIFTKNLVKTLPKNYHLYWLLPEKVFSKDCSWFYETHPNITLIPYPYSTSIHQNRYEFYGNVLKKNFPYGMDIDFVINNQPEVSASIMAWANNQRRDAPILINFYHWIDCEKSRKFGKDLGGYFWRQYDGYLSADINFFHGQYAFNLFYEEVVKSIRSPEVKSTGFFYPQGTFFGDKPIPLPNKKILLFNHRLNNTTQWKKVVDICNEIYKNRQDFILWITDDSKISFVKSSKEKYPFIHIENVPFESYGYLLKNSHFAICNHKGYSTWNMAVLDCFKNECFCIVPDYEDDVYISMFEKSSIDLFHSGTNLKEKIEKFLDIDHSELRAMATSIINKSEYPLLDTDIVKYIESRIRVRVPDFITKYAEVKSYINNGTTKKKWVNEFWSFHVNSNFQKIRWKLLLDGIVDDTTNSIPTYSKHG